LQTATRALTSFALKSVAIIGAGITGLTAAFYLKRKSVPVTVYEAADRAGGVIRSSRQDGFLAEAGPNTILETSPRIPQLVHDAGLATRRRYADAGAKNRYLVRDRRPVAMPGSLPQFVTTKLFSGRAKLAVLREPFVPARRDGVEESVAEFVRRRLNGEFLERAVDALVAGIYAGDPEKLSVRHALPRLYEQEQRYGSLLRGQVFGARHRKRSGEIPRSRAKMFSFDQGLQVLPDALALAIGDSLKLGTAVSGIARRDGGWQVATAGGEARHDVVVYCGTAHRLAEWRIESPAPVDLSVFAEVRYAPVASIVLGFRREAVRHPLDGFGMLVPGIERFNILGSIFSSSLFPDRAPAGAVVLTSYIGGERQPALAGRPADELVRLALDDLGTLLGVKGEPVFRQVAFYPKAIPQYNVGYGRFKQRLDEIEGKAPGLFFAGHYRDGVSLGDSIVSGCNIADRVSNF